MDIMVLNLKLFIWPSYTFLVTNMTKTEPGDGMQPYYSFEHQYFSRGLKNSTKIPNLEGLIYQHRA